MRWRDALSSEEWSKMQHPVRVRSVWGFSVHFCSSFILGAVASFALAIQSPTALAAKRSASKAPSKRCATLVEPERKLTAEQARVVKDLTQRYKIDPDRVKFAPNGLPIIVEGRAEKDLLPDVNGPATLVPDFYDVLILGGGPAGTTAAHYVTKAGYRTLLLEREKTMGGLANGITIKGPDGRVVEHAIGGAYVSGPYGPLEHAIYREFELQTYKIKFKIGVRIDSLYFKGEVYNDFWEDPAVLAKLPPSFAVVKKVVEWADDYYVNDVDLPLGQIGDQVSAQQFIEAMPQILAKVAKEDAKAAQILERFKMDPRINLKDRHGMGDVLDALLNNYSRSALGEVTAKISATPFLDFYISEVGERFTGTYGSGSLIQHILKKLDRPGIPLEMQTGSNVLKVSQKENYVEVTYAQNGKLYTTRARRMIFAGNLKLAPRIIEGFQQSAPERFDMISNMETAHYNLHVAWTRGRWFTDCYDLWFGFDQPGHTHSGPFPWPTDMIDFLWQSPKAQAYREKHGFDPNAKEPYGVYGIYQPLGVGAVGKGYTEADAILQAEHSVEKVKLALDPILKARYGKSFDVAYVQTFRWPISIDIVRPGFQLDVNQLSLPLGRIHFALKYVPETEEAMRRGRLAADEVIEELGRDQERTETRLRRH